MCLPACIHLITFSHGLDCKNSSPDFSIDWSDLIPCLVKKCPFLFGCPFSLKIHEGKGTKSWNNDEREPNEIGIKTGKKEKKKGGNEKSKYKENEKQNEREEFQS